MAGLPATIGSALVPAAPAGNSAAGGCGLLAAPVPLMLIVMAWPPLVSVLGVAAAAVVGTLGRVGPPPPPALTPPRPAMLWSNALFKGLACGANPWIPLRN